ncbi:MAG: hypothetical protein RKK15_03740 [Defluviicoccus sp.]|nr:hypothetical protein [Defluviicoccus sp.]
MFTFLEYAGFGFTIVGGGYAIYQICQQIKHNTCLQKELFFPQGNYDIDERPYALCLAEEVDIDWIFNKSSELHGEESSPRRQRLSWFHKNPKGVWVIKNSRNNTCGSVEIFPVRCSYVQELKQGTLHEKDKTADDIFGPNEDFDCLYIESIMAVDKNNQGDPWVLREIIARSIFLLDSQFPSWRKKHIFNQTVSTYRTLLGVRKSNAAEILEKLGFVKVGYNSCQRVPIYRVLGEDLAKAIERRFPST